MRETLQVALVSEDVHGGGDVALGALGQEGGRGGLQDGGVVLVGLEVELRAHPQASVRTRVRDDLHLVQQRERLTALSVCLLVS